MITKTVQETAAQSEFPNGGKAIVNKHWRQKK